MQEYKVTQFFHNLSKKQQLQFLLKKQYFSKQPKWFLIVCNLICCQQDLKSTQCGHTEGKTRMENLFNFLQTFFGRRRRCCNIRRQYTAFNFARHCHFLHLFFINTNFSLPLCLRYKFQHKKVFLLCQSFWVDT